MFFNQEVAYKYKMSAVQAALGLAQLERIEELVNKKRQIFTWYSQALKEVAGVTPNYEAPLTKNTFWMVTVILAPRFGIEKLRLIELMAKQNIDCRPFFFPLSQIPAYKDHKGIKMAQKRNTVSYSISPYGVNLPSGMNMTEEKVEYVCNTLKSILHDNS